MLGPHLPGGVGAGPWTSELLRNFNSENNTSPFSHLGHTKLRVTYPSLRASRHHLFPSSSDCSEETSVGIWEVLGGCRDETIEKSTWKWTILCLMKDLKGVMYVVYGPLCLVMGNIEYGVDAPSESSIWPMSWKNWVGFGENQCMTS